MTFCSLTLSLSRSGEWKQYSGSSSVCRDHQWKFKMDNKCFKGQVLPELEIQRNQHHVQGN